MCVGTDDDIETVTDAPCACHVEEKKGIVEPVRIGAARDDGFHRPWL